MNKEFLFRLFDTGKGAVNMKEVLGKYDESLGFTASFWNRLREDPKVGPEIVTEMQFTVKLGELTSNHLPLVRELQRLRKRGALKQTIDLLSLDWKALLEKSGRGRTIGAPSAFGKTNAERVMNYARFLSAKASELFPTAGIALKVRGERDHASKALVQFFESNPAFDFAATNIGRYLAENPDALNRIPADEIPDLLQQLKKMQRLFRITHGIPHQYEAMRKLRDDGLDSAQAIARMGQAAFCTRYPVNPGVVKYPRTVYAKALQRAITGMALLAKYSPAYHSVAPAVVPKSKMTHRSRDLADPRLEGAILNGRGPVKLSNGGGGPKIPDWPALFGSLDVCECEHCRSVLSPSAYLVDLLALLDNLKIIEPKASERKSALEVLLERRPDIAGLKLSCANADTPMPYVDLVNEVLEQAVFPLEFSIRENLEAFEKELNSEAEISQKLREEFQKNERPLSDEAKISYRNKSIQWHISDRGWQYIITSVLEEGKSQFHVTVKPPGAQTTGSADDLSANPEHLQVEAYESLKGKVFPWKLPFDLWAEEARVYLQHLGILRYRLMEIFKREGDPLEDLEIASEYLGMSSRDRELITQTEPQKPWRLWGLEETENSLLDPDHAGKAPKLDWLSALRRVPVFLEKSGLTYEHLTQLLKTKYINPLGTIAVHFPAPSSSEERLTTSRCDLDRATLSWPEEKAEAGKRLNRAHTFLRLQRKCGWSILELDKVIRAFGVADPKDDFILAVRHLRQLQDHLRVQVVELLSWYSPLDTEEGVDGGPSLYEKLFLNRSVVIGGNKQFHLNPGRTDLESLKSGETLMGKGNIPVICAALRISADELSRLVAHEFPEKKDAPLNRENLSRLYRGSSVAHALNLSIQDFLSFREMVDVDPFRQPKDTVLFVEEAQKVKRAGFSIAELDYLLRHFQRPQSNIPPAEDQIAQVLGEIREGLHEIHEDNLPALGLNGERVARKLAQLNWDEALIKEVVALLRLPSGDKKISAQQRDRLIRLMSSFELPTCTEGLDLLPRNIVFPPELRKEVYYDAKDKKLAFRGWMSEEEKQKLLGLSPDPAYQDTIHRLFGTMKDFVPPAESRFLTGDEADRVLEKPVESRFDRVLEKLLPYICKVASEFLVKQKLAEALGLEAKTIHELLTQWLKEPTGSDEKAIHPFLTREFAESHGSIELTATHFPAQFNTYRRLHKVALLVDRFKMKTSQLAWLSGDSPLPGCLNLNELPTDSPGTGRAKSLFAGWSGLVDLFTVRDQIGEEAVSRLLALAKEDTPRARQALSEMVGWNLEDLARLARDGFKKWDGPTLKHFQECFAALKRLGASAEQALRWSQPAVSFETAESIKQAVKAKYDEKQWLAAAKPLRDALREKQRAALVTHLTARRGLRDSHDLYQHYLIDVDMSPCMMTSRTLLAISSVQLYVQRLLMNLEAWQVPPELAADCKKQWPWLKNYRVWEANRKVFLYPENWIEPDLRKDKTALFKELESELLQGEVTHTLAEGAFRGYLERLSEVARLKICGLFHEKETSAPNGKGDVTVDVLHVFGRTDSLPHSYYYSRRADKVWTTWEKVDAAIDEDHLIPVVFNRRLYLFWPTFIEKSPVLESLKDKDNRQKSWEHWGLQLAYSEYRQGRWSAKKISDPKVTLDIEPPPTPEELKDPNQIRNEHRKQEITDIKNNAGKSKRDREEKSAFTFKTWIGYDSVMILCGLQTSSGQSVRTPYKGALRFTKDGRIEIQSEESVSSMEAVTLPIENSCFEGMVVRPAGEPGKNVWPLKINGVELLRKTPQKVTPLKQAPQKITPRAVSLLFPHQLPQGAWLDSFFYQDEDRTFFLTAEAPINPGQGEDPHPPGTRHAGSAELANLGSSFPLNSASALPALSEAGEKTKKYRLENFYHPGVCDFVKHLNRDGVEGLLRRSVQQRRHETLLFWLGSWEKGFFTPKNEDAIKRLFFDENKQILEERGLYLKNPRVQKFEEKTSKPALWEITFAEGEGSEPSWQCVVNEEEEGLSVSQNFEQQYAPNPGIVIQPWPAGEVDFSLHGAYSQYNWDLFFHAPLLLADRLSKNQRFEEAQSWFHHIFDPTDVCGYPAPQRYWKVLPFFTEFHAATGIGPIIDLIELLHYQGQEGEIKERARELQTQVELWRKEPFEPHLIARLRTGAYQKTVVMKYIDNLIAWADQLFRQDTVESINEATQLYILAVEILGRRPPSIAPPADVQPRTFEQLKGKLDEFTDALVEMEEAVPPIDGSAMPVSGSEAALQPPSLKIPYFCIPRNDRLLSYWDVLGDRLFKIRHCLNIEGIERRLPLFQPPIEPGLLVRAKAAGIDISSALRELSAPLPYYRFKAMLQKAIESCNDVKALGAAFLASLEKRDEEGLARLRTGQRLDLSEIKKKRIEEAQEMVASLEKAKEIAEAKKKYLSSSDWGVADVGKMVGAGVKAAGTVYKGGKQAYSYVKKEEFKGTAETSQQLAGRTSWKGLSRGSQRAKGLELAAGAYNLAMTSSVIPTVIIGGAGISSPVSLTVTGGDQVRSKFGAMAKWLETIGAIAESIAEVYQTYAEIERQKEEARHEQELANLEIEKIEDQIQVAKIRQEIAEKELKIYEMEQKHAEEVNAFIRDRFTNLELYNWMVSQLSSLYFQSYQMAYDVAKRAEKSFHYELGQAETPYIQFGYWDSLKKGLLAGEQLSYDLKRMEKAYLEQNKRGYEMTRHISLACDFPLKLVTLKETGECFVDLEETLFDFDYPGHYLRRIKSVSLTIQSEADALTNIHCTLTLLRNSVRTSSSLDGSYGRKKDDADTRFRDEVGAIQSIVTSSGKDDSGLFELNFQDERYLPFEGAGAISSWKIDLPQECNRIDIRSISDVVLHVKYTALEGGEALKKAARDAVVDKVSKSGLVRLFSVRDEFPEGWAKFLSAAEGPPILELDLSEKRFPKMFEGKKILFNAANFFVEKKEGAEAGKQPLAWEFSFQREKGPAQEGKLDPTGSPIPGFPFARIENLQGSPGKWLITVREEEREKIADVENLIILFEYTIR